MKIVLFGATDLTAKIATFLQDNNYNLAAIISLPEIFKINYKPDGLLNSRYNDLSVWSSANNVKIYTYQNNQELEIFLEDLKPDFGIVAGWYYIIPKKIRNLFTKGCAGFHASLLPKFRGGAPLNWALLSKASETGVSFFELSDGMDDGNLYFQKEFPIAKIDNIQNLIEKAEIATIDILKKTLPDIIENKAITYPQKGLPTYCGQRIPEDGLIDWSKSADEIQLLIRSVTHPYPGAYTFFDAKKIIIWNAEVIDEVHYGIPGQILKVDNNFLVICGNGILKIKDIFPKIELKHNMRFNKI